MPESSSGLRKKKRFAPPIDLDELYNAPNLRGMCSFLERPPEEAETLRLRRLAVDATQTDAEIEDATAPTTSPPVIPFPAPTASLLSPPSSSPLNLHITRGSDMAQATGAAMAFKGISPGGSDIQSEAISQPPGDMFQKTETNDIVHISQPPSDIQGKNISQSPGDMSSRAGERLVSPGGRVLRIKRCVLVQDGHSTGEQALYAALWAAGEPDGNDGRLVTIGQGALARKARLDITNVRKNLRLLEQKLAIEVVSRELSDEQQGKTYRIFSYARILDNRQKAGLEWVVRSKGVMFVSRPPDQGMEQGIDASGQPPSASISPGGCISPGGGKTPGAPPGKTPGAPPGDMHRASLLDLNLSKYIKRISTSSELSTVLVERLRSRLKELDDDAVRMLCQECIQRAPDCTAEEVEYCFNVKASQLLDRGKTIKNPVGLLLRAVPKCFEGVQPLYLVFRKARQSAKEQEFRQQEEWNQKLEEYRRLAEDPQTSAEDRAWYERLLGQGT